MATIMSDNAFGSITAAGAGFLAPSLLDASGNGPVLTYARRNDTSGTQATAQAYFMGTSCNTVAPLPVIAANTTAGQLVAQGLSSTGNVRTQLNINGVSPAKVYSIGIMSAENNQTGQTWKWLRVGGASGVDSAVPDAAVTNSASAIDGRFDYWFESKVAAAPSPASAGNFWTAVTGNWGVLSAGATKGLFALSETQFTKGGAGCQPAASN
jgi:hypothetical protein